MRTPDPVAAFAAEDLPPDPVIVTGMPRTGVRLLGAILDGHPALASGPDLPVIATLVQQWHEIRSNLSEHHERNHRVGPGHTRAAFREAALKLFAQRLQSTGKQRSVIQSFAAVTLLEQFASLFRQARFILTVRDPRAIAHSLLQCDWRDRTGEPLAYTRDPVAAARFTVQLLASNLQAAQALHREGRLMVLYYERLCVDPADAMAGVGAFLDEPAPHPFVSPVSAELVTRSLDNPHPALRCGSVDAASLRAIKPVDSGPMAAAIEQLRRSLGYREHGR